jgi:exodeoxyribonuclease VII large subunit
MSTEGQLDFTFQPQAAARRVWRVCDLVGSVRTRLEREFTDVWVEGELSNVKPAESGHIYFTLKDGSAQLRAVMFRLQVRLLRFRPDNGQQVIARGRVTVYDARGDLQLLVEYLEPKGAGALQVAFEQLKAKLEAEGLFSAERKKPIPTLPRRIGVVTSPRGAAMHDILNVLRRRHENVHILIYAAQVQGETAAAEVATGVKLFNMPSRLPGKKPVDVIIVARGGGSAEDLAAFNNEALARTIADSQVPVISAVGHETDFTIVDFVADLRAPTPSAAAELVIRSRDELDERLASLRSRLGRAARYRLLLARNALTERAQHGAFAQMRQSLGRRQQRLDELTFALISTTRKQLHDYHQRLERATTRVRHHDLRRKLATTRREVESRSASLISLERRLLADRRARVEAIGARLEALSPLKVLERGYALVFDASGKLIKDAAQVAPGDEIKARVARGEIESVVKKSKKQA